MVVSEHDLTALRERQNQEVDVKTDSLAATNQLLSALDARRGDSDPSFGVMRAAEAVTESLRLPLTRTVDEFIGAAFLLSLDYDQVQILGLNSRQHAHAVVLGELCHSFLALNRANQTLRDSGDGAIQGLKPGYIETEKSLLALLSGAARAYADCLKPITE